MIDGLTVLGGGALGVLIALILTIIAILKGLMKRAYTHVGLMMLFLTTSLGGCGYLWKHFDIPSSETGNKHLIGLALFAVGGVLAVSTAVATFKQRKKPAEPAAGATGGPLAQP